MLGRTLPLSYIPSQMDVYLFFSFSRQGFSTPQAHGDMPASASSVLELKACTTSARLKPKMRLKMVLGSWV